MKSKLVAVLAILGMILILSPSSSRAQNTFQQNKGKALNASDRFLALVDSGQYGKSWEVASPLFKGQVSKQEWVSKISRARPSFGGVIHRKVNSAKYLTSLPGAPDGEYFLFTLKTAFQKKHNAVETITVKRGKDGKWRVAGYFIR